MPSKKRIRKILFIAVPIIVAAAVLYFIFGRTKPVTYESALIERGDITQTVEQTGTVKSAKELALNFLASGRLNSVAVKVGDMVKQSDTLAMLDQEGLLIQKRQQEANLFSAQANLNKLIQGATREELAVADASVDQARVAYESALKESKTTADQTAENIRQAEKKLSDLESSYPDTLTAQEKAVEEAKTNLSNIQSTYSQSLANKKESALITIEDKMSVGYSALDAVKKLLDDDNADNALSVKNTAYLVQTTNDHAQALEKYNTAKTALDAAKLDKSEAKIYAASDAISNFLSITLSTLNNSFKMLENSITSSSFSQTTLDAYKTSINTQITAVNTAASSVQTAKQSVSDASLALKTNTATAEDNLSKAENNLDNAIQDARNALNNTRISAASQITLSESKVNSALESYESAKRQRDKVRAGANTYDIESARAAVRQSQANLDSINKQITDSTLIAPINGTVVKVNFESGEFVAQNASVVSILGENNLEVEVNISESDVAKMANGQIAKITLDAFGEDEKLFGRVYSIDPAETVVQDVIYYKAKIEFLSYSKIVELGLPEKAVDEATYKQRLALVKSGMTANISIVTAERKNVLWVPTRAIIDDGDVGKFIRIVSGAKKTIQKVPVVIGLRGDGGQAELLSGAKEGSEIVVFMPDTSAK